LKNPDPYLVDIPYSKSKNPALGRSVKILAKGKVYASVADPGSCAFLTPGSGIGFFRIPDPKPIFGDNFLGKNFNNSFKKLGQICFFSISKIKLVFSFVKCVATKNGLTKKIFTPVFCCCFWTRDG
jgi:hypothetical protein